LFEYALQDSQCTWSPIFAHESSAHYNFERIRLLLQQSYHIKVMLERCYNIT